MAFKQFVKDLVENEEQGKGRIFNLAIKVLIILSMISISLETLPDIRPEFVRKLYLFEVFSVMVFSIEYLARIYAADKKLKFIFSFYGLIDLLAILPFYLTVGFDLRSLRAFRLLRLVRILKFTRYNAAFNRMGDAFRSIQAELGIFFIIIIFVLYLSALGIYYFENPVQPEQFKSVFHSLWWAVATLTTVGYGDVYPVTVGGRIFTFLMLMVGLGLISVPTGLIASAMTKIVHKED
ncbi:MAG: ion transporter [Balneolaceae bacterium]|nr:ion transporter [Balneolaceae bacterium]